jgi:hypothetical protein
VARRRGSEYVGARGEQSTSQGEAQGKGKIERKPKRQAATLTLVTVTAGYRKKKNWLSPGMIIAQMRPSVHARRVATGMVGSSVFATAERTSGYGES